MNRIIAPSFRAPGAARTPAQREVRLQSDAKTTRKPPGLRRRVIFRNVGGYTIEDPVGLDCKTEAQAQKVEGHRQTSRHASIEGGILSSPCNRDTQQERNEQRSER